MKRPLGFVPGNAVWPPVDSAADRVIQTLRLLRELLAVATGPRKRLGRKRLEGVLNNALALLEGANLDLGSAWEALGCPDYQEPPPFNPNDFRKKG